MKRKTLIVVLALIGVVIGVAIFMQQNRITADSSPLTVSPRPMGRRPEVEASRPVPPVPAHYQTAPSIGSLAPTLPPEKFFSRTRDAYRAVKEIPQTIAQLPCYCHCDEGFNYKSLHSCFEDEHAASCAVCVGEALMACRLQKEQGLTAPQIRARIIAEYSKQ